MGPIVNMESIIVGFLIPILLLPLVNIVVGIIAVSMAKKRGLRTVPAFFAGFFGSFLSLFFIAMFPKNY
ncbi:MAG: hypothetical protein ACYDG2_10230 [Ruminiclostridium sp.]